MASRRKPKNPFYVLLLVVGVAFALTACGYGTMTVRMIRPLQPTSGDRFFDTYGIWLMVGEVVVLAILTFAAISTDDFWARRAAEKAGDPEDSPQTSPSEGVQPASQDSPSA